ncbi:hypothetical protein PQX77_007967 [Marasmius sp. AFHP31]|nr:hypothetical protein PQX77_007967 [Marasmius sp. AFHP31]
MDSPNPNPAIATTSSQLVYASLAYLSTETRILDAIITIAHPHSILWKSSCSSAPTSSQPSPPTSSTNPTLHSTITQAISSAQSVDRTTNMCMATILGCGILVVASPLPLQGSSIDESGSKTTFPGNPCVSSRGRGRARLLVHIIRYGGWSRTFCMGFSVPAFIGTGVGWFHYHLRHGCHRVR